MVELINVEQPGHFTAHAEFSCPLTEGQSVTVPNLTTGLQNMFWGCLQSSQYTGRHHYHYHCAGFDLAEKETMYRLGCQRHQIRVLIADGI